VKPFLPVGHVGSPCPPNVASGPEITVLGMAHVAEVRSGKADAKAVAAAAKPAFDFTGESVYYEGGPATGDLVANLALGTTL
jgi:hypothetical protein